MAEVKPDTSIIYNRTGNRKVQGKVLTAKLLTAAAATGASSHINTKGMKKGSAQILGTFVGTIKLEGSIDGGTIFAQIGSDITAPSIIDISIYAEHIRLNVTAFTSGTIDGHVAVIID